MQVRSTAKTTEKKTEILNRAHFLNSYYFQAHPTDQRRRSLPSSIHHQLAGSHEEMPTSPSGKGSSQEDRRTEDGSGQHVVAGVVQRATEEGATGS